MGRSTGLGLCICYGQRLKLPKRMMTFLRARLLATIRGARMHTPGIINTDYKKLGVS